MKFSQQVRQSVEKIWQASFEHPFVRGIADGTLPLECFRFYVLNDAYYLSQFAKVQALGSAKANDLHTSNRMAIHVQGTFQAELALHENFSNQLGITQEEKDLFAPSPTSYAYTSHLIRVAYTGHLGDIIAVLLPCYWLYYEIGERFAGSRPQEPIYQEWIAAYNGKWFRDLVEEQIDRLDQIAEQVTDYDRKLMKQHFVISSQYEYSFWEAAYRQEKWAIG